MSPTDDFPTKTPPLAPLPVTLEDSAEDGQINRINELTRAGRANWFGLMAYLAFMMVTVLGVEDADFFVDSRQTQLPLIGVSIPTFSFFIFAPILGAALYVYLHLHIRKCVDALCKPPHRVRMTPMAPEGVPLENPVSPWLLNDMVLRLRGKDENGEFAAQPRHLDRVAAVTAFSLIWLAGPVVMLLTWLRSLPAHSEKLSLLVLFCAVVSLFVGTTSKIVLDQCLRPSARRLQREFIGRNIGISVIVVLLSLISLCETEFGYPSFVYTPKLATTDLRDAALTKRPDDWIPCEPARNDAKASFAEREGIGPNDVWSDDQNDRFVAEWQQRRRSQIASVGILDLREADLRNADFRGVFAVGLQFPEGLWQDVPVSQKAILSPEMFEGSTFFDTRFCALNWSQLPLDGINLSEARLNGANLHSANLSGAILDRSSLVGAVLSEARMQGANLRGAQMQGADPAAAGAARSPCHVLLERTFRGLRRHRAACGGMVV